MTATNLFDLLFRDRASAASGEFVPRLAKFADNLVASSLNELERLKEYEQNLALHMINDQALELELRRSIWQLFRQWTDEAERVMARAKSLEPAAHVEGVDRLDRAIGSALARLSIPPEQIVRAKQQAREGQFIPAKENER